MAMIHQPTPKRERGMATIGEILAELLPTLEPKPQKDEGKR